MKYRLKKDLPFAKAGAEIVTLDGESSFDIFLYINVNQVSVRASAKNFDKLKEWGWIEEVKPREWEVTIFDGIIPTCYTTNADCKIEKIKVREVIE